MGSPSTPPYQHQDWAHVYDRSGYCGDRTDPVHDRLGDRAGAYVPGFPRAHAELIEGRRQVVGVRITAAVVFFAALSAIDSVNLLLGVYRGPAWTEFVDLKNSHVYARDAAGVRLFLSVDQMNVGKPGKTREPSHQITPWVICPKSDFIAQALPFFGV
jgi:hypothetical protein